MKTIDLQSFWKITEQYNAADPHTKKIIWAVVETLETVEEVEKMVDLLLDKSDGMLVTYADAKIQKMRESGWMTPDEAQDVGKNTYREHKRKYDAERKKLADELDAALVEFKKIVGTTNPKLQALINRMQQLIDPEGE
jgi:hypothetical protein